jgi:hypothetical protein
MQVVINMAMAIILKANKVNLFVSSVLWYHSPNILDTPHICNISRLRVNGLSNDLKCFKSTLKGFLMERTLYSIDEFYQIT